MVHVASQGRYHFDHPTLQVDHPAPTGMTWLLMRLHSRRVRPPVWLILLPLAGWRALAKP